MEANEPLEFENQEPIPQEASDVAPWELVDVGRYRPLRIRGSYRGRELG